MSGSVSWSSMRRTLWSALGNALGSGIFDAVIVPKVVESDVLHRVVSLLGNQLHDAVAPAVNRVVLELHNRASSESRLVCQITCEAGYGGDYDDDFVLLASAGGAENTFNDSSTDLILDWLLFITRCRNEELVLDIDEVFTVLDDLSICILDRVLGGSAVAPFSTATQDLAGHVSALLGSS